MLYKTELHCHSAEVSWCAKDTAEHIADWYVEHGYTTLVLTNHFSSGTMKRAGEGATWKQKVDFYVAGYEKLKAVAGDRLHVLFSAEARVADYTNDYLLYGATPEFFYAHPHLLEMGLGDFSPLCREAGIFFVQAHPFRDGITVVNPRHLDGVEVYNGSKDTDNRNLIAEMWATMYHMPMTSGSDHHLPQDPPDGGILTEKPITTLEELVATLRSGEYDLYRA